MNKLAIPAILAATVLVAGIFAFMPVQQASTVHTSGTITTVIDDDIASLLINRIVQHTEDFTAANNPTAATLYPILDVSDVANGMSAAHITVTILAQTDDADNDCSDDVPVTGFNVLAGNAPDLTNTLNVAGMVVNTGITAASNVAAGFDVCVYHGEVTLAELTAADANILQFNDVIVQIPIDCDSTGGGTACIAGTMVTVTGALAE